MQIIREGGRNANYSHSLARWPRGSSFERGERNSRKVAPNNSKPTDKPIVISTMDVREKHAFVSKRRIKLKVFEGRKILWAGCTLIAKRLPKFESSNMQNGDSVPLSSFILHVGAAHLHCPLAL